MAKQHTISLYWKCQLAGWSVTSAYWAVTAYIAAPDRFLARLACVYFVFDVLVGIGTTHIYRLVADKRGWVRLPLRKLAGYLVPAVLLTGAVYMVLVVIKNYYARALFGIYMEDSLMLSFRNNWLTIFATGIRLMAIWILAFHLYHFARLQIESAKENARLQVANREAALNNLSAQLNPHFFFNALNTIKALVSTNPAQARRVVDLLSELMRQSLYRKDDLLIPLQEEILLVNDYLELEKIRLEHRLEYAMDIPQTLLQKRIPRWSMQTLVENAVKHGVAKIPGGGSIHIRVAYEKNTLFMTVENPGILLFPADQQSSGLGLANLQERLQLQYGSTASVILRQADTGVVHAILTIPVN